MEEHEVLEAESLEECVFDDIFFDDDHSSDELDFSPREKKYYE